MNEELNSRPADQEIHNLDEKFNRDKDSGKKQTEILQMKISTNLTKVSKENSTKN
jgi:hypothetical protein